jgi:hypothetical protein
MNFVAAYAVFGLHILLVRALATQSCSATHSNARNSSDAVTQ